MSMTIKRLELTLPIPPITNHRLIPVNGRLIKNKANRDYYNEVKAICIEKRVEPFDGDVDLRIVWYRKSKRGDVPDRWKGLCDALQAKDNYGYGIYHDDKQIKSFTVTREDGDANPRIEVTCIAY